MKLIRTNLGTGFGAEVGNIDCAKSLTQSQQQKLNAYLDKYHFLLIRKQKLNRDQYLRFSKYLGKPGLTRTNFYKLSVDKRPLIVLISNMKKNKRRLGLIADAYEVHADGHDYPGNLFRNRLLHAKVVPDTGGETLFVNTYLAYDDLDQDMKNKLKGIHINFECVDRGCLPIARPIIRVNPKTKQKSLFIVKQYALSVEGMTKRKGLKFLREMTSHLTQPKYIYQHAWQQDDIIIWDNRGILHAATKRSQEDRMLWSIQLY